MATIHPVRGGKDGLAIDQEHLRKKKKKHSCIETVLQISSLHIPGSPVVAEPADPRPHLAAAWPSAVVTRLYFFSFGKLLCKMK